MIITRSPLRITLGGGGTDLPSYYEKHGGLLLAVAIDKYVYITLHQTFEQELIVKYSRMERTASVEDVQHPIVRECLRLVGFLNPSLEITSMADIPAGTGLGSSGSFTTALLKALHTLKKNIVHPRELAEQACHVELELLKEPIGKQDQYVAAFGGMTCFEFRPDGSVGAEPVQLDSETLYNLEDNLLLFFTGQSRSASAILRQQDDATRDGRPEMLENLHFIKEMAQRSRAALRSGDLRAFAELMNEHWQRKKQRSAEMTSPQIDEWYDLARRNGALGGKLIGAGGGGFLLFFAEDKTRLRHAMTRTGLREVRFRFEPEGTKVVIQ
jgi:D-glycero-alpha-D-manno-heptose-7-phosphate kinase